MKDQTQEKKSVTLLGIESSGSTCSVGVSMKNQLQGEISINGRNIHSEKLAPFVEFILENLQITFTNLDAIVLSAGPGSFTGLRIGYSLAKGIAHPLNMPIIEVPTLDVWAYQVGERNIPLMSVVDAYREEIFYSIYGWDDNQFRRQTDYSIIKIDELGQIVNEKMLINGSISDKLKSDLKKTIPSHAIFQNSSMPSVGALLELGFKKYEQEEFSDLNSSEPFYMRKFKGVS